MNAITDIQAGKGLTRALAEQARTLSFARHAGDVRALGAAMRAGLPSPARSPARPTN